MSGDRFAAIKAAELALLSAEVRRDGRRLDELLHADFVEIGRSGRRWTRDEIIAALRDEPERALRETDDWRFLELADDIVLVTFRIATASGESRHSSIWDTTSGTPVMRFHQGTPVAIPPADGRATLKLCVLLWAREGREQDLHDYEDAVLALLTEHGGELVSRERVIAQTPADPTEVQIIALRDQAAMDAYLSDPRRTALHVERDAAIADTQILRLA